MKTYPVYVGHCPEYNSEHIGQIILDALQTVEPSRPVCGNVVIKPNLVMAHPKVATEGFTRKQVIEGILMVLSGRQDVTRIDIVEKAGLGVTTSMMYRHAGYRDLVKKYPVRLRAMEEGKRQLVILKKGRLHPHVHIAKEMAERDFLIFAPKLKTNVLSQGYSGALKLNIGTIDSIERIRDHNQKLTDKITDLLEIANPDLIITDGIRFAYGGNQMTQHGMDFGAVIVSANAVAHDMVCASLIGLDPMKIDHIRAAAERGYGPSSMDEIEIAGDFPLSRGKQLVKGLDFGFQPVHEFKSNFNIISGSPYCTGGCQGIFLDWLLMIQDRRKRWMKFFPKWTVLIGQADAPPDGRTLLLVGRCAFASRHLKGRRCIKIWGCPPTHKRIVLTMMCFGILAPLVLPSLIWDSFVIYPLKKIKGWILNWGRA
ncbi:DUF362 domain-containing protein [bacterium]|nr:DUF362 domain-containing protein [bacterium]